MKKTARQTTAITEKKAPKPPARKKAPRSRLEVGWIREWDRQGGPRLEEEFVFHPTRKWRADFAHLESRTLIEIEGGANGGRHTRITGFKADLDKYLTAALHGWEVIRVGAHQVRGDIIAAVIGRMLQKSAEARTGDAEKSAEASGEDDTWPTDLADMIPAFEGSVVGFSATTRVEGVDSAGAPVWLSLGPEGMRIVMNG